MILLIFGVIPSVEEVLEGLYTLRLLHRFLIQRELLLGKVEEVLTLQLVNLVLGVADHERVCRFLVSKEPVFLIWGVGIR